MDFKEMSRVENLYVGNSTAKWLLEKTAFHANVSNGYAACFSYDTLSRQMGFSFRTIDRAVKFLEKNGFITVHFDYLSRRWLKLTKKNFFYEDENNHPQQPKKASKDENTSIVDTDNAHICSQKREKPFQLHDGWYPSAKNVKRCERENMSVSDVLDQMRGFFVDDSRGQKYRRTDRGWNMTFVRQIKMMNERKASGLRKSQNDMNRERNLKACNKVVEDYRSNDQQVSENEKQFNALFDDNKKHKEIEDAELV